MENFDFDFDGDVWATVARVCGKTVLEAFFKGAIGAALDRVKGKAQPEAGQPKRKTARRKVSQRKH